jgi:hypothetical protein
MKDKHDRKVSVGDFVLVTNASGGVALWPVGKVIDINDEFKNFVVEYQGHEIEVEMKENMLSWIDQTGVCHPDCPEQDQIDIIADQLQRNHWCPQVSGPRGGSLIFFVRFNMSRFKVKRLSNSKATLKKLEDLTI